MISVFIRILLTSSAAAVWACGLGGDALDSSREEPKVFINWNQHPWREASKMASFVCARNWWGVVLLLAARK